jgi:hypothetical protein
MPIDFKEKKKRKNASGKEEEYEEGANFSVNDASDNLAKRAKAKDEQDNSKATASAEKTKAGAENTTQAARQGAVGGVDTGGTGYIHTRGDENPRDNYYSIRFTKHWNFFSHPWAKRTIWKGSGANARTYMSTSMCFIPIHYPFLYASHQEWTDLPPECYVVSAEQKLSMYNARTSFETNATDSSTATQGNQLWLNFTSDVFKYPALAVKNSGAAAQPVLTTDITSLEGSDLVDLAKALYGGADPLDFSAIPPAICGTWTEWNWYVAYAMGLKSTNSTVATIVDQDCGTWNVGNAYDKFLAVNNVNTHIYTNRHNFGGTLVTRQKGTVRPALPATGGSYRLVWNEDSFMNRGEILMNSTHTQATPGINTQSLQAFVNTAPVGWTESMWRPERHHLFPGKSNNYNSPPRAMGFGLEEIVAMSASNDLFQYQEGQILWKLSCTLNLKCKREYTNLYSGPTSVIGYKDYTDGIYAYNTQTLLLPEDEGQGFMWGRPTYT